MAGGEILFAISLISLIGGALLALPISLGLLALYRRAVIRKMLQPARIDSDPSGRSSTGQLESPEKGPPITRPPRDGERAPGEERLYTTLVKTPRRAVLVYLLGGTAYALFMASCLSLAAGKTLPVLVAELTAAVSWPVVIIISLAVAHGWQTSARFLLSYILLYGLISAVAIALSPTLEGGQVLQLWAILNVLPTILLGAFLSSRVRAVGPMVFTFMFFSLTGMFSFGYYGLRLMDEAGRSTEAWARALFSLFSSFTRVFDAVGLADLVPPLLFGALWLLGLVVVGAVGWLTLRLLSRLYLRRVINGQSLVFDSIILMFGLWISYVLAPGNRVWLLAGFGGFAVYRVVTGIGFALLFPHRPGRTEDGIPLLLLRVFALGKRSEQLYDAVEKHWRYVGPVQFITGPDLLTSTVKPHNFLDYVGGALGRLFIASEADLEHRLEESASLLDRDGTYRNQDFFCYENTWRRVLGRLALQSRAILMDLRDFGPQHAGCRYEIETLVQAVPLNQVVFVVDRTTDEPFLRKVLETAWQNLPDTSPNLGTEPGRVRLLQYERSTGQEFPQVLRALSQAAAEDDGFRIGSACELQPQQ